MRGRSVARAVWISLPFVSFLAIPTSTPGCARPQPQAPPAPNLLLITSDTLRADHVGTYGYSHARTPALDSIAHAGRRYS